METGTQNSAYLLDDIDLFTSSSSNNIPNLTGINGGFSSRSARTNSLIDAPIPVVQTDKLIDWSDFQGSPPPPVPTTAPLIQPSNASFVEQWPEVPSVNVEHRVSSTSSTSSQKDLLSLSIGLRQNGPAPAKTPTANGFFNSGGPFGIGISPPSKDLFRCDSAPEQSGIVLGNRPSKSANTIGLAVPPKIEQRKSPLGSAPPAVLSNGSAFQGTNDSSVRYQRLSSATPSQRANGFDSYADGKAAKKGSRDFDDDDEEEDDDEVFLHIGSAGERASVLAPLTGARKKKVRFFEDGITESELLVGSLPPSASSSNPGSAAVSMRKGRSWRPRLISLTLTLAVLLALAATVIVIIYAPWKSRGSAGSKRAPASTRRSNLACASVKLEYLGNVSVEKVYPTSALTTMCTKGRDCKDTLVFGYGSTAPVPCYDDTVECRGGVKALDISTGNEIWLFPALGEVNGVNCRDDLNGDGTNDCLASGKRGVLLALDGKTGKPIWESEKGQLETEFFMPQVVPDMDNDGVPEVLATMVDRSEDFMRLYFLSGKTGQPYLKHTSYVLNLKSMDTIVPSMIWKHGESLPDVVISAGSFNRRGGIYSYELQSFLLMRLDKGRLIYNSSVLTPPVFADVNGDSFGDMIFCTIAGELISVDGATGANVLWTFKAPQGQCAGPLVLGFYNSDSSPDVAASFCFGQGFPSYRYCETVFVDGRTGQELKGASRIHSLLPSVTAGLSVRTNSNAGDVFLVWNSTCGGAEESVGYRFLDAAPNGWRGYGWSNICRKLFNRPATYQLLAAGAGLGSSAVVFDSSTQNFDEELEKFAASLEGVEPGLGNMGKRKWAWLQIGPAGALVVSQTDEGGVADLVLPTYISVASELSVVPNDCMGTDDPRLCANQFDRFGQQQRPRQATADFSGGMLLHKLRLRCTCASTSSSNAKCAEFISDNRYQPWAEYLGSNSDGRFLF